MAGPHIQAIQISCQLCSNVDIKDSWAHQNLQRAHKNFKRPIKIGNLHVFEWDMGHWPILRAHHHFGLGLTLPLDIRCKYLGNPCPAEPRFIPLNSVDPDQLVSDEAI